jgi:hypothetical protein
VDVLRALELQGKVLIVLPAPDEVTEKSFRNLSSVKVSYPGNLSTYDLLYADRVLFTGGALDVVTGEKTAQEAAADAAAAPRRATSHAGDDAGQIEAPIERPRSRRRTKATAEAEEPEADEEGSHADSAEAAADDADAGAEDTDADATNAQDADEDEEGSK